MKNILNKRNGIEMGLISFRVRLSVIPNIYLLVLILYFLTFKTHTPTFKFLEFFSSQISSLTIHRIHTMIKDIFSSWLVILSTCSIFNCPSLGVIGNEDLLWKKPISYCPLAFYAFLVQKYLSFKNGLELAN